MSFLFKPFQRKTPCSKASKKSVGAGEIRRASFSGGCPNASFVGRTKDESAAYDEGNEDDVTMSIDASLSTGHYGNNNNNNERNVLSGKPKQRHTNKSNSKKPKTKSGRRGSVGGNHQEKDEDEKLGSLMDELMQFEEFVKKVSSSQKGEKLLQDHMKNQRKAATIVGGRKL
jgi:hypothetical protein